MCFSTLHRHCQSKGGVLLQMNRNVRTFSEGECAGGRLVTQSGQPELKERVLQLQHGQETGPSSRLHRRKVWTDMHHWSCKSPASSPPTSSCRSEPFMLLRWVLNSLSLTITLTPPLLYSPFPSPALPSPPFTSAPLLDSPLPLPFPLPPPPPLSRHLKTILPGTAAIKIKLN